MKIASTGWPVRAFFAVVWICHRIENILLLSAVTIHNSSGSRNIRQQPVSSLRERTHARRGLTAIIARYISLQPPAKTAARPCLYKSRCTFVESPGSHNASIELQATLPSNLHSAFATEDLLLWCGCFWWPWRLSPIQAGRSLRSVKCGGGGIACCTFSLRSFCTAAFIHRLQ